MIAFCFIKINAIFQKLLTFQVFVATVFPISRALPVTRFGSDIIMTSLAALGTITVLLCILELTLFYAIFF